MHLRSFSRAARAALTLGLGASGALAVGGCGREVLLVEGAGGDGGAGGSGGTTTTSGPGGTGGTGGSTCTAIEELCNTIDDDCDGQVDEGCACTDGQTQPCYSGPVETIDVGPCAKGTQQCQGGAWGPCSGETVPIPELCDLVDNDCNGAIDDGDPGGGMTCNVGLKGECAVGALKCQNGSFVCAQAVFPKAETCDGLDNNCNGQVDDNIDGGPCSTGLFGVCNAGTLTCVNAQTSCQQNVMPSPEVCDSLDNDCNGQPDQGNPGGGAPCNTGLAGACAAGTTVCQSGAVVCLATGGGMEVCDGVDNDCDGIIDDVAGLGNLCLTGAAPPCNQGTLACTGGMLTCKSVPNNSAETCDNLDNNCNGQVDEGNPGGGVSCNTGIPGVCGPGSVQCQAGVLACIADASQGAELCAGASDEDCDGASASVFFTEAFANNAAGWTLDQEWAIGSTTVSEGQNYGNPDPSSDHTATGDNGVAGVVLGGNASTMLHPFRWLTSPTIAIDPATPTVFLQFWRWLNSDFSPWMTNRVEVLNGLTNQWEQVWQSGGNPGVTDDAWTKQVYDITAKSKGGSIKVRFGFNVGANGSFTVSQWNVDDVAVTTEPCE